MPARWSTHQERLHRNELRRLYVRSNLPLKEVAQVLGMSESGAHKRLLRLGIRPKPSQKPGYLNRNLRVRIPRSHSEDLAEFIGIMLGDGHLSPSQVTVTLGTKEVGYAEHVVRLMKRLFVVQPKRCTISGGYTTVYLGSTRIVRWLQRMGLASNKVKAQVNIPLWCRSRPPFMRGVLRGLIDTDGSVYRLRRSTQMSFCNRSKPLLRSARLLLISLDFTPSRISGNKVYLTRAVDLVKYSKEVGFHNPKHKTRFRQFAGGSDSGNSIAL